MLVYLAGRPPKAFFSRYMRRRSPASNPHPSQIFFSLFFQSDTMDFFFSYSGPKRLRALCSAHSVVFRPPLSKCTLCKSIAQKTRCEINEPERRFSQKAFGLIPGASSGNRASRKHLWWSGRTLFHHLFDEKLFDKNKKKPFVHNLLQLGYKSGDAFAFVFSSACSQSLIDVSF